MPELQTLTKVGRRTEAANDIHLSRKANTYKEAWVPWEVTQSALVLHRLALKPCLCFPKGRKTKGQVAQESCSSISKEPCSLVLKEPCSLVLKEPSSSEGQVALEPCSSVSKEPCSSVSKDPCSSVLKELNSSEA